MSYVGAKLCEPKREIHIKIIESLVLKKKIIWEELTSKQTVH
jgi:hypothetical protein